MKRIQKITTFIFLLIATTVIAQEQLSLDECYLLVTKNYPLAKQKSLLAKQNNLDVAAINTAKLPMLNFSAQASYQSDVTKLPIALPNITVEPPNKDQYKAVVSVNQILFDGGAITASSEAKKATLKTQQKQVEVSLYQLKKQINQLYFSILLIQEKKELITAKKKQLTAKLKEVNAGIEYGTLLPSSNKILEAEILKIEQQFLELSQNRSSLISTLSNLTGKEISSTIILNNPTVNTNLNTKINRPELDLFNLQKQQITASEKVITKKNIPKILAFASGGYGNPGLNFLDNSFQTYYMVGIKLNWNIFDWNTTKKQQKSLQVQKEIIDNQQEIFQLNTHIELNQQQSEIDKIASFIQSDKTIIELRKKILKSADSQLKNGVITSSAYITELTNLYEAENTLKTHKIELLLAKANYKITKGI